MSVGVATANSILMVTFANDQMLEGHDSRGAALAAGATRLRPVLMTAIAMVIGMLPMSLGLGEGGEQNSPLGRAVVGGLYHGAVRHPVPCARRVQPAAPSSPAEGLSRRARSGRPHRCELKSRSPYAQNRKDVDHTHHRGGRPHRAARDRGGAALTAG